MLMRTPIIEEWWPTTQSLDLIRGSLKEVGSAIQQELCRVLKDEPIHSKWIAFRNLNQAFGMVKDYTNIPTAFLLLPTFSDWCVLWNNSYLCDGYDSLCYNLTRLHGFETLHWTSHDSKTTFLPGTVFSHRILVNQKLRTRSVYCAKDNQRWIFHQAGKPLVAEKTVFYSARIIRNRLNEQILAEMLMRLGAEPWNEQFYNLGRRKSILLQRLKLPDTIKKKSAKSFLWAT
jgi:hypothetical protein